MATVRYTNQQAIRDNPAAMRLEAVLRDAAAAAGIDEVVVGSGGQEPAWQPGGKRTGSTRHDLGNAADVRLIKDGAPVSFSNPEGQKIFADFAMEATRRGATGIGAGTSYMGPQTIHVGFGTQATWGGIPKNGQPAPPPPSWLTQAVTAGRNAAPVQVAGTIAAPQLRARDMPLQQVALPARSAGPPIYGAGGLLGGASLAFAPTRANYTPPFPDFTARPSAPPPPPQMASSIYGMVPSFGPTSTLAGAGYTGPQVASAEPPETVLTSGGMSPLRQILERSEVPGNAPYGADTVVRAAMSGDAAGFQKAMDAVMAAAVKDALPAFLGGKGLSQDQIVANLQGYFNGLPPGAVRQMQTAYNSNPAFQAAIPEQMLPAVQAAFSALPPAPGMVAMPNLRPPMPAGTPQTPPLVADAAPQASSQLASLEQSTGPVTGTITAPPIKVNVGPNGVPTQGAAKVLGFSPPAPSSSFIPQTPPAGYAQLAAAAGPLGYLLSSLPGSQTSSGTPATYTANGYPDTMGSLPTPSLYDLESSGAEQSFVPPPPRLPSWTAPTQSAAQLANYQPGGSMGNLAAPPDFYQAPKVAPSISPTTSALYGYGGGLPPITAATPPSYNSLASGQSMLGAYGAGGSMVPPTMTAPTHTNYTSSLAGAGYLATAPMPNLRPPMPSVAPPPPPVPALTSFAPSPTPSPASIAIAPPSPPPMPQVIDITQMAQENPAEAAAMFGYDRPSDADIISGAAGPMWTDPTQFLPDLGWDAYY